MPTEPTTAPEPAIGLAVVHETLPPLVEQTAALTSAGVPNAAIRVISPMTIEDWYARPRTATDDLQEGTVVVPALFLCGRTLVDALEFALDLAARGIGLVALADQIDTLGDANWVETVRSLVDANERGIKARAELIIASAAHDGPKSPPKARLVPARFVGK